MSTPLERREALGREPFAWPDYEAMMAAWRAEPDRFWLRAARAIDWHTAPGEAARPRGLAGLALWFADGRLNTCFNALDRHVRAGFGARPALVWDSPASGGSETVSYAGLLDRVARFAGGLRGLGIGAGDRVLITMPNLVEAVVAMLACARLGAVHVFVFAGFAAPELARRIDAVRPSALIAASCHFQGRHRIECAAPVEEACRLSACPPAHRIMLHRAGSPALAAGTLEFAAVAGAAPVEAVALPASHPLYILHTSGTTGRPKGVVRDTGGHAVAMALSMRLVYGLRPGGVVCAASDLGWVVGHSYAVYGPLIAGCTSVLYEGGPVGTPDAGALWRLCAAHRVQVLLTSPTALRLMRQQDPAGQAAAGRDLSALEAIFVAGERSDPATLGWARKAAGTEVLDHWWQTETGWSIAAGWRSPDGEDGAPNLLRPSPGMALAVLDEHGAELPAGESGELVLRLPLPPGALQGLWEDEAGFAATYLARYPGYYRSFDVGRVEPGGAVRLLSRSGDVLKLAGRRIAAGLIEEAIAAHPAVAECAVAAEAHGLRGEVPAGFVVLVAGARAEPAALLAELNELIRARVGRFARLRRLELRAALPRTRSGKILRRALGR